MSHESRTKRAAARSIRIGLAVSVLVAAPRVALACPVCFGQNDSPLALGINYGILAMLGIIVVLWVAFGSFFLYLARRARMVEAAAAGSAEIRKQSPAGPAQADSGFHPQMQGGAV